MCGIALLLDLDGGPIDPHRLQRMTAALRHRGPDDEAYLLGDWTVGSAVLHGGPDSAAGPPLPPIGMASTGRWSLGLGVRRLALRHADEGARQPMEAPGGTGWLAYNGELYDLDSVRDRLRGDGWTFRTRGDTEVLLAAWQTWGLEALAALDGMWAFVLWEPARRRLWVVRDRFGIKPLYYARLGTRLIVASEIKAVREALESEPRPHLPALVEYVETGLTDHTEETCLEGIRRVAAGHLLAVVDRRLTHGRWAAPLDSDRAPDPHSRRRAFHAALDRAVASHLESECPVGALLSGGLDSGTIVLSAHAQRPAPSLDLFTASVADPRLDEAGLARGVSAAAHWPHHLVPVDASQMTDAIASMLRHHDEPVASTSVVAQGLVMREASAHGVRVLLDGQGADELLLGYPALAGVAMASRLREGEAWSMVRAMAGRGEGWRGAGRLARAALAAMPAWVRPLAQSVRASARGSGLAAEVAACRWPMRAPGVSPGSIALTGRPARVGGTALTRERDRLITRHLPALLRYLDHNAMAWSIEARVPFLARPVVEAGLALTGADLWQDGFQKWILRDPEWSRLPDAVRLRSDKIAFATPESRWWRGPLRPWLRDVLAPATLRSHGVLDPVTVARALEALGPAGPTESRVAETPFWRWANVTLWLEAQAARAGARPR